MKSGTTRRPPDIEAFHASLKPAEREAIARADAMLDSAEEGDTESAFIKGDAVKLAHGTLREGSFAEWCRLRWKKDRSYAYDHLRVAENLGGLRTRIIRARIQPSAVLVLASQPDRAEAVLETFEAGDRHSVAEVKAMLAASQEEAGSDDATEPGGLRGLQELHAAKRLRLRELVDRLEIIVAAIETALGPDSEGKRVVKGALASTIVLPARHARLELLNLCAFLEPEPHDPSILRPTGFAQGSKWNEVLALLYKIGGADSWPPATQLKPWLQEKVLPLLKWASRGGANERGPRTRARTAAAKRSGQGQATSAISGALTVETPQPVSDSALPLTADGADGAASVAGYDLDTIRDIAKFLTSLRDHGRRGGAATDELEQVCRRTASVMADFLVCGGRVHETPGPAADERQQIAQSLYDESLTDPSTRDECRNVSTAPL